MNSQNNTVGDFAHELAQLDHNFQNATASLAQFSGLMKAAKDAFDDAVSQVYDAYRPHYYNIDLLKAFCVSKQIPWSEKKYIKNRFLPIVGFLFEVDDNLRAFVSYTLCLACEENVFLGDFKRWFHEDILGGYRGGYDLRNTRQKAARKAALAVAHTPWLLSMHKAAEIICTLTFSAVASDKYGKSPQYFLLRNAYSDEGELEAVLELVSTAYTFTAARLTFSQRIADIAGRAYLFSDAEMRSFVTHFLTDANWTVDAQVDELLITSAGGLTIKAEALTDMYTGDPLRKLAPFRSCTDTVTAILSKMNGFSDWLDNSNNLLGKSKVLPTKFGPSKVSIYGERDPIMWDQRMKQEAARKRLPKALDFDGSNVGFMSANLPWGLVVTQREYDLFNIPPTHQFATSRECQLHIKHARRLCAVFGAVGIQPDCYVAYAHEAESAFVCEASLGDARLLVAFPTVMNPKGALRCLAEDLVLAEVLGQSIRLNGAEAAAISAPDVPLIAY